MFYTSNAIFRLAVAVGQVSELVHVLDVMAVGLVLPACCPRSRRLLPEIELGSPQTMAVNLGSALSQSSKWSQQRPR